MSYFASAGGIGSDVGAGVAGRRSCSRRRTSSSRYRRWRQTSAVSMPECQLSTATRFSEVEIDRNRSRLLSWLGVGVWSILVNEAPLVETTLHHPGINTYLSFPLSPSSTPQKQKSINKPNIQKWEKSTDLSLVPVK